jgi:hypothetical protein
MVCSRCGAFEGPFSNTDNEGLEICARHMFLLTRDGVRKFNKEYPVLSSIYLAERERLEKESKMCKVCGEEIEPLHGNYPWDTLCFSCRRRERRG